MVADQDEVRVTVAAHRAGVQARHEVGGEVRFGVSLESVCRESVCRSQSLALLKSDSKVFVLQCQ